MKDFIIQGLVIIAIVISAVALAGIILTILCGLYIALGGD